jgi:hypothetical protein
MFLKCFFNVSVPHTFTSTLHTPHTLQAWEQPGTGLLINERLINSPPQLAPPLVQALFSEISWATEDEPTQVGWCC